MELTEFIFGLCRSFISEYALLSMNIFQVISNVGDLVGIKYLPVEQEETTSVEKPKKL